MDLIISYNCLIVVIVFVLSGYSCTVMFHIALILMRIVEIMSAVENRQ